MLEEVQGERSTDGERVTVYRHTETREVFTQIVGGLAWPGTREGFLAVVGEKAERPRGGGRRPLILMHEAYAKSMVDLARECAALERLYFVNDFHTNVQGENGGYADRFYDLIREHKGRSCAYQTSLPENFGLALQILRQRFQENGLLLFKDGILVERLGAINHEDPGQKDLHEKYPEVMVLAACVYELDSNPTEEEEDPDEWRNRLQYQHDGRSRVGGY
jgi:hypothetical protein